MTRFTSRLKFALFSIHLFIFSLSTVLAVTLSRPDPYKGPMARLLTRRSQPIYKPSRQVDIQHMVLRLKIDDRTNEISGSVTYHLRPFASDVKSWTLDSGPDLIITAVNLNNRPVSFLTHHETLVIRFPEPLPPDKESLVTIEYHGKPRKGLYFIHPDRGEPDRPVQVWSQGEAEDNHYWFPTHDFPNERFTTETYFTVRKPFQAISNGGLVEVTEGPEPGWHTWHWKIRIPHVSYLVSVAVGEFHEIKDDFNGIPVLYYIPKRYPVDWGRRAFGRTPDMMRFFSQVTGYPYPYEKYAQVAVEQFIFGGMENISATTQTARTLRDDIAEREGNSDGLVAHELAHQWFGDLLTCESWAHAWLNEGFATYFTALWFEHDRGKDDFDWTRFGHQRSYLAESRRYKRPLNWDFVTVPMDLFDRHTYPKGALVLHQLRTLLGEERFWKGIQHYVKTYAMKTVEAGDFQNAMEDATGVSLDWFFDQWVHHAGHPRLKIEHTWDAESGILTLKIRQIQERNAWIPLFRIPTRVRIVDHQGKKKDYPVVINDEYEIYRFQVEQTPAFVLVDPGRNWMMEQEWDKSIDELAQQLHGAESVIDRAWAARELGRKGGPEALEALASALKSMTFTSLRGYIAGVIGDMKTSEAGRILAQFIEDPEPRVRVAVIQALASTPEDASIAQKLERRYDRDKTYGVRSAIIWTLVKWRKEKARRWIERGLREPSFNDQIARTAIRALGELKDRARVKKQLRDLAGEDHRLSIRTAAIQALGSHAGDDPDIQRWLERLLYHEYYSIRSAALRALGEQKGTHLREILKQFIDREADDRLRVRAIRMLEALDRPQKPAPDLEKRIDDLREELLRKIERLEEKIEELEKGGMKEPSGSI